MFCVSKSLNTDTILPDGHLEEIRDLDSCVLKLVLACASITENSGHSDIGNSLFETVRNIADRMLHTQEIDLKTLPFLVLVVSLNGA